MLYQQPDEIGPVGIQGLAALWRFQGSLYGLFINAQVFTYRVPGQHCLASIIFAGFSFPFIHSSCVVGDNFRLLI